MAGTTCPLVNYARLGQAAADATLPSGETEVTWPLFEAIVIDIQARRVWVAEGPELWRLRVSGVPPGSSTGTLKRRVPEVQRLEKANALARLEGLEREHVCRVTGSRFDLGWAGGCGAAAPAALCHVKHSKATDSPTQCVKLALADVYFAALARHFDATHPAAALVIRIDGTAGGGLGAVWGALWSDRWRSRSLVLDPGKADDTQAVLTDCAGNLVPRLKTYYKQIFGGGTSGKFVGLYEREGKLTIPLTTRGFSASNGSSGRAIAIVVGGLRFEQYGKDALCCCDGARKLALWLP